MKQQRPWLDEVIDAFRELGGDAEDYDLYCKIQERNMMNLTKIWKGSVKKTIGIHSSDSDDSAYTGKDVFYRVKRGHWG